MPYQMGECAAKAVTWGAWIDYYRATIRAENVSEQLRWDVPLKCIAAAQRRFGKMLDIQPWQWLGYRGERIETVSYGENLQGYIIQASGGAAENLFNQEISVDSVARLDLAVTVWYDEPVGRLVGDAYGDVKQWRETQHKGRPYKLRFIDGTGDGDTLYIGQRGGSGRFVRVYDKHKESKSDDYANAIRWEVELSDKWADEAAAYIAREGNTSRTVSALVGGYLRHYGTSIPNIAIEDAACRPAPADEASSAERRLDWLKRQVRPAIAHLLSTGVKRETVLQALGLLDGM